ncbi:putative deoxyribonuclease TATDN1 [Sergentomyia squamirostris]
MFQGIYRGTKKHQPDLEVVLKRSWEAGMEKMIVTVGELSDVEEVAKIVEKDDRLVMTVGCHPMNCGQFVADPEKYFMDLKASIEKYRNKVVAAGEMGLDYYLEEYCERECQKKYFEKQIELMEIFDLPVFLHCRDSYKDFMAILERNMEKISHGGVVHSFDGSLEEANRLIDMGFYLGLTGCSMKTEEQLKVVKAIPIERIMIETDAPWCSIRSSYAAAKYVKTNFSTAKKKEKWSPDLLIDGRCEPVQILYVGYFN